MHPEICDFPNKHFYEGKLRLGGLGFLGGGMLKSVEFQNERKPFEQAPQWNTTLFGVQLRETQSLGGLHQYGRGDFD